jgi:hypothetical protein
MLMPTAVPKAAMMISRWSLMIFAVHHSGWLEDRDQPGIAFRRGEEQRRIGDKATKDAAPVESSRCRQGHHDGEKGKDDHGHHGLDDDVENLSSRTLGLVKHVHEERHPEHEQTNQKRREGAVAHERQQVLLDGRPAQVELRHAPDDIRHHRGDQPGPAQGPGRGGD